MYCYACAERGTETPAVALCRSCQAGLCLEHSAEQFAADKHARQLPPRHVERRARPRPPHRPGGAVAAARGVRSRRPAIRPQGLR